MEGTGEENSPEAPHIKGKEDVQVQQQSDNCIALQSPAPVIAEDIGWTEHLASLGSPEMLLEALAGKGINFDSGAHSLVQPPNTSSCPSNFPETTMEGLTAKCVNSTISCRNFCSGSVEGSPVRKGFWENLTRIAGRSRSGSAYNESARVGDGKKVAGTSMSQSLMKRPLAFGQFGLYFRKTRDNVVEDDQILSSNTVALYSSGFVTKDSPASGSGQYVVESNLKGKEVACEDQGTDNIDGQISQRQTNVVTNDNMVKNFESLHNPFIKTDEKILFGEAFDHINSKAHGDWISLREWIKQKRDNFNKLERLNLFKQVLQIVDTSHSEGIALLHLRPSYFVVTLTGAVNYIGSFSVLVQPRNSMGSIIQDTTSKSHLKRKKETEQDADFKALHSHKNLKLGHDQELHRILTSKHPMPTIEKNESVVQGNIHPSGSGLKGRMIEGNNDGSIKTNDRNMCPLGFQEPLSRFHHLEDRWYASPEVTNENSCSFASNIYSLGVLFFELFCYFGTEQVHIAAMSNLRNRILPPSFLSVSSKEAGFCFWLLHPDPSSRPNLREVLSSNLIYECKNVSATDQTLAQIEEKDPEAYLLLHFLSSLREQKVNQVAKLVTDIQCLETDTEEVERRQLLRANLKASEMLTSSGENSDVHPHYSSINGRSISAWSISSVSEERMLKNIDQLEHAYFSMRSNIELSEPNSAKRSDVEILKVQDNLFQLQDNAVVMEDTTDCIGSFFEGLCKYARCRKFEVRGGLRNIGILNSTNVICSLCFDHDENYFAAAGVSKKIKIFEFEALLNDTVDVHYPLIEMSSRAKLSCVSWNNYIKNYLASSDYDGVVQLWDASTGQAFTQYAEHEKRAWSVDFSPVDPTKLASGSDDCTVKLWSIKEKNCIDTIRNVANVCCVQFAPHTSHLLAFGSADYMMYCYDLRKSQTPWCTLSGHGKAVSYVKFVDCETVVSASTDNTLKLWDLNKTSSSGLSTNACSLTFAGHTNEKNFVGLSAYDGYIVCGSETNEVYAYYKAFPMSITSHKFGSIEPITGQESGDHNGQFVSSVCWRTKSNMVVAANSSGRLKILQLV